MRKKDVQTNKNIYGSVSFYNVCNGADFLLQIDTSADHTPYQYTAGATELDCGIVIADYINLKDIL